VTAATVVLTSSFPHRLPNLVHSLVPFVFLAVACAPARGPAASTRRTRSSRLRSCEVAVCGSAVELGTMMLAAGAVLSIRSSAPMPAKGHGQHPRHAGRRQRDRLPRPPVLQADPPPRTRWLQAFASADPLTGSANRRAWDEASLA
jgi:hypothetical protein